MKKGFVSYVCPYRRRETTRPQWVIEAEPHIILRMKRTFAQVDRGEKGRVVLSDTPDNARDLVWFLDRFPMEVQAVDRLQARADEHSRREQAVANLFLPDYVPPKFELAMPLRVYQRTAVDLALKSKGLLLGDEIGLGKTIVAIGTFTDQSTLPALVVTLTHLTRQWASEIRKFAPNLKVKVAKSAKPEDLELKKNEAPWDVLIVNYHKLGGLAESLTPNIRSVIFDEAQELRRDESAKYRGAAHIAYNVDMRTSLSATPIYNYGGEIWAVLNCTAPDSIGSKEEFHREWCSGWDRTAKLRDPAAFGTYLRDSGLMLRRTRIEVGRELPDLTKIIYEIDADVREIDKVADHAAELARIILTQSGLEKGAQMKASEELSWRLRQATGIAKAIPAADFTRMLVESGEKVLLFGYHHAVYDLWRDRLRDLAPAFFTGLESDSAKAFQVKRFTSNETNVLIMATRAGAGVDGLQHHCRTVVYGELDWSPAVLNQGIGRLHRDGQTDPVMAYYLVSDQGSDPIMRDVLGLKQQQLDGIVNPDAPLFEKTQADPDAVKRLAADFLKRRGLTL